MNKKMLVVHKGNYVADDWHSVSYYPSLFEFDMYDEDLYDDTIPGLFISKYPDYPDYKYEYAEFKPEPVNFDNFRKHGFNLGNRWWYLYCNGFGYFPNTRIVIQGNQVRFFYQEGVLGVLLLEEKYSEQSVYFHYKEPIIFDERMNGFHYWDGHLILFYQRVHEEGKMQPVSASESLVKKAIWAYQFLFSLSVNLNFDEKRIVEFVALTMYKNIRDRHVYKAEGKWHIRGETFRGELFIACLGKFRSVKESFIEYLIEVGLEETNEK